MQLTVLGCRGGMPANGQPSSGYLVDSGRNKFLLDCGPGIATALSDEFDASVLDAVIISHLHVDHCYDLLPLGKTLLSPLALAHYPGAETAPAGPPAELPMVPLYVPAGSRSMLDTWASLLTIETMPLLDRVFDGAFDVREYEAGDTFTVGDSTFEMVGLKHAKTNCGTRVTTPSGSLAYTGDTGVCDGLVRLADGMDLLLAEASLERTDLGAHGHLCAADAARAAARGNVGELMLTHFPSNDDVWLKARLAEAVELFPRRVHLATPGARITVGA
ncbi:MAG TPA: MBL fold metallo-hydrolase [Pseudonocardiaceae bacterium]|nr:MBL fold metallo-hydrolase [Pseudonocardiaceae bacterium]